MMMLEKIKMIKFKAYSGDYMYDISFVEYHIEKKENKIIVSFINKALWGVWGFPSQSSIKKQVTLLTESLEKNLNQLVDSMLCYPGVQFDLNGANSNDEEITINTSDGTYYVEANSVTIKALIDFIEQLNFSTKVNTSYLTNCYNKHNENEKPLYKKECVLERNNSVIEESPYSFKFSYTNIKSKSFIEIKINFDYESAEGNDFFVLCRNTKRVNDVYVIEEKSISAPTNNDLKEELIAFYKKYSTIKIDSQSLSDDFCEITYNDSTIKFPKSLLRQSFYDLLDYIYLGEDKLPIAIENDQKDNCSKYKYYRFKGNYIDNGFYQNDSFIEYLKLDDEKLYVGKACFSNCKNLKEVHIINRWFTYREDNYFIDNSAFSNNANMTMYIYDELQQK